MASAMSPTTLDATIEKMSESREEKENGVTDSVDEVADVVDGVTDAGDGSKDEVFKKNQSKTDAEPLHYNVSGPTLTQAEVEAAQKAVSEQWLIARVLNL